MVELVLTSLFIFLAVFSCVSSLCALETLFNCKNESDKSYCFKKFLLLLLGFVVMLGGTLLTGMVIGDMFLWA